MLLIDFVTVGVAFVLAALVLLFIFGESVMPKRFCYNLVVSDVLASMKPSVPRRKNGPAFSKRTEYLRESGIVVGSIVLHSGQRRRVCRITPAKFLVFYGLPGKFDPLE